MKKQAQRALFLILMALGIFFPRLVLAEELLTVHFLDVGQADAIIVECGGEYLMIDGGNVADSQYIFAFLRNTLQISHLDYIVATHPHEDHIGGIPAALNACSVGTIFSPVADYDSEVFRSLVKYAGLQGVELSIPANGESFLLGDATACFFTTGKEYSDMNNSSLVVKITHGETSFLFMGDAEVELEHDLVDMGVDLSATVLKVGHHGSDSSSSYYFLRAVMPQYAVISVGRENPYGHPSDAVLSRLHDEGAKVYRTDLQGDILCTCTGDGTVSIISQREANDEALFLGNDVFPNERIEPSSDPTSGANSVSYIGNSGSFKFHRASCHFAQAMSEDHRVFFPSRNEAISQGYVPCKWCNP